MGVQMQIGMTGAHQGLTGIQSSTPGRPAMHPTMRPAMRQSLTDMRPGHRHRHRTMQSTDLERQDWLLRWRHLHQVLLRLTVLIGTIKLHKICWLSKPLLNYFHPS